VTLAGTRIDINTLDANGNSLSDAQGRSFTSVENRLVQAVVPGQEIRKYGDRRDVPHFSELCNRSEARLARIGLGLLGPASFASGQRTQQPVF
jgi:hypothetical protein